MSGLPPFSFSDRATPANVPISGGNNAETLGDTSTPTSRPKRRGRPPSIGIRLGGDGKADVTNMTPEQLGKIRTAISGTSLLSPDELKAAEDQLRIRKESYKPLVKPLLKLIGTAESAIIQASRKCPKDQADIFQYSDAEIKVLEDPTAAVIAKHGGRLEMWQEEITFLLFFVQIFHEKCRVFNEAQAATAKAKQDRKESSESAADIASMSEEAKPVERVNGSVELRK